MNPTSEDTILYKGTHAATIEPVDLVPEGQPISPGDSRVSKITKPVERKISQVPASLHPKETEEYFTGGKCDLCQVELTRRYLQWHLCQVYNQTKLMFL